jgi:aconitate hydratase
MSNPFGARTKFNTGNGEVILYRLNALKERGIGNIDQLPFSIKILLENALRNYDDHEVQEKDVVNLASWNPQTYQPVDIPFKPSRVILQDFTGVACVVDLAALRSAMVRMGGDPKKINPIVPVDLVIDHSVQVDFFGSDQSLAQNMEVEFERNMERYEFLRWGQQSFDNFKVVPPATGIVHQVNLEYLAKGVQLFDDAQGDGKVALFDTVVGTDSHTTMINGLGVLGWGVGGIEAEAAMLGQPIYMTMPEVIGFKLTGSLPEGATATDLVLVITQMLRKKGVVDKFVEFYGTGLSSMSLPDRATIANMAPEYGATMGFFPVDEETLSFMRRTGRDEATIELMRRYSIEQGVFRTDDTPDPMFTDSLSLDLSTVEPSMAGPARPQDRVVLRDVKSSFQQSLRAPVSVRGFELSEDKLGSKGVVQNGHTTEIGHGAVVVAAITSCTNTSNPSVMVAAGLLAKKAVERGLKTKPYVKTSLAPGSKVVTEYLNKAELTPYLEQLGFYTVGYGCTTCIGNTGPLPEEVSGAIKQADLVAAAVLSGNRNFSGRISADVKANYLASPPLVVAYALAGTVDIDIVNEPIGHDQQDNPVYLREIWPSQQEIMDTVQNSLSADMFKEQYGNVYTGNAKWNEIPSAESDVYAWDDKSTYIQEPPFFVNMSLKSDSIKPVSNARVLGLFGDSITTDHISPAGSIASDSPAGKFLLERGVTKKDFNSYGTRRGNDRIMTRGTFANIRLRNLLVPGSEGGITTYFPTGDVLPIYDAAMRYIADKTELVILAGKDYGMGSSRDWAAKGTFLLGVKAVIAESFERIHRSNLVMMGVLPLEFESGQGWQLLGLTGKEKFSIPVSDDVQPKSKIEVTAITEDGTEKKFTCLVRLDTLVDVDYYRNGGILQTVLRGFVK